MAALMPYLGTERDPASQVLLQVIASTLNELIKKGERNKDVNRKLTKFHGLRAPSIPLPDYLNRIAQFSGCSNEAFVLMLIYLDRLVTKKEIPLDSLNVHRLVITATLLAAKFFDDHYLDNSHYSAVGGLPRSEINELELEMLFLLGFNLFVTTENYNTYYTTLTNMAQSRTIPQPISGSNINMIDQHRQQQANSPIIQQQVTQEDSWVCVDHSTGAVKEYTEYFGPCQQQQQQQQQIGNVVNPLNMMKHQQQFQNTVVYSQQFTATSNTNFGPQQLGNGSWYPAAQLQNVNQFQQQQGQMPKIPQSGPNFNHSTSVGLVPVKQNQRNQRTTPGVSTSQESWA